jgi:hypothetical protein
MVTFIACIIAFLLGLIFGLVYMDSIHQKELNEIYENLNEKENDTFY